MNDKSENEPLVAQRSEMDAYRRTIAVYSTRQFANMYFEKWANDIPQRQLDDFASRLVPGCAILDSGCGPGHHTAYLERLGFKTVGIDLSEEALRLGTTHNTCARLVRCDMLLSPFRDSSFSAVWSCAAFQHLPESLHDAQLAEFRRLLHPGGMLALTLTVGQVAHVDGFGRFFQTSPSSEEFCVRLDQYEFEVVACEQKVLHKTTQGDPKSAEWATLIARRAF